MESLPRYLCHGAIVSTNPESAKKGVKLANKCGESSWLTHAKISPPLQTGILGSGSFGIVIRAVDETAIPKHEVKLAHSMKHSVTWLICLLPFR